jgi:uncharacterized protein YjgD (DUF1641 family)
MKSIIRNKTLNSKYEMLKKLYELHEKLRNIRNKIAHADVSQRSIDDNLKVEEHIKEVQRILNDENITKHIPNIEDAINILLNEGDDGDKPLLCKCIKAFIIKNLINAYNLNNDIASWKFLGRFLLNKNTHLKNKISIMNSELNRIIEIYYKLHKSSYYNLFEIQNDWKFIKSVDWENIKDINAIYSAILSLITYNFSEIYNEDNYSLFRWLLQSKKLCWKVSTLKRINNEYYKLYLAYKNKYPVSEEILQSCNNIIEIIKNPKNLIEIKNDLPIEIIKTAYSNYYKLGRDIIPNICHRKKNRKRNK